MSLDEILQKRKEESQKLTECKALAEDFSNGVSRANQSSNNEIKNLLSQTVKGIENLSKDIKNIHITLGDVTVPKPQVTVNMPKPEITVNVPDFPEQKAPIVNVPRPEIIIRETTKEFKPIQFMPRLQKSEKLLLEEKPIYKDGELDGFIEKYSDGSQIKKTGLSDFKVKYEYI